MDTNNTTTNNLRDASRGIRLQKAMAEAGVASRRLCEEMIEAGLVSVNGIPVTDLPAWVDPELDEIMVDGRVAVKATRRLYVMLYKPKNVMCTADDPEERKTVVDLVEHPSGIRLFPVGRLDYETMGLLLLTNDGELTNRLTHPSFGVDKVYRATVKGSITEEAVEALRSGVFLADRRDGRTVGASRTGQIGVHVVHRERERTVLEVTLGEGRNRQVRRMLATLGFPVRKLVRIRVGPLELKGLQVGEWREVTTPELQALRKAVRGGKGSKKQGDRNKRSRGRKP